MTNDRAALLEELERERELRQALEKRVEEYQQELERVAAESGKLLGHLSQRQAEGDRLRTRLQKVLTAYEALQQLHHAMVAGQEDLEAFRAAWSQAMLELGTPDG